jgi:hypothetical protein
MARWRQAVELGMSDEEIGRLAAIARSRSEAARRVERAQILLTYRENSSFFAVGAGYGVQDSCPRESQAAQGAVLSGTSRRRVRAEEGGGSVRLSRGPGPEKGRQG